MNKTCAKRRIGALNIIIVLLICVFCSVLFCACNSDSAEERISESDFDLYLTDVVCSEEDGTVYATVMRSGDEEDKLDVKWHWITKSYTQDVWYNRQDMEMTVNSAQLYEAVSNRIAQTANAHADGNFNRLIVALRYDTIYKSVKSDGEAVKNGRYYQHSFYIDGNSETQTYNLALKTQNSANWYTVLIVCAIIFAVALTGVSLAVKGGIWQKKKKKNG